MLVGDPFREVVGMRSHRRNPDFAHTGCLAIAKHRAIRQKRDLDAVTLDDGRPARFLRILTRPDDVFPHATEQLDGVEERLGAPVQSVTVAFFISVMSYHQEVCEWERRRNLAVERLPRP